MFLVPELVCYGRDGYCAAILFHVNVELINTDIMYLFIFYRQQYSIAALK